MHFFIQHCITNTVLNEKLHVLVFYQLLN